MINSNRLPNQRPDEKTLLLLRRHWVVPFKICAFFLFSVAIPVGVYFLILSEFPNLLTDPLVGPTLAVAASFYYLAIWMLAFQEIVNYYLDMWIVTTERVVNIEQFGLFVRTASELHLENIMDVTSEVRGMLHTFLNYGDVMLQTAAEKTRFHFKQIPRPELVRQIILKAVDEDRSRHQRVATSSAPLSQSNDSHAH
ncbi:MAG: PH domain-containing protein [Patescibacteria group bacterium]